MKLQKDKTVAFTTGYRTEKLFCNVEDKNLLNVIYTELYRLVSKLYQQGYTHFYSGMSEGIDMLAANAVLDFKEEHPDVRFVAVIPFKGQQEQYSTTGKNDYQSICTEADEIVTLADEFTGNDLYLQRNNYLLENCSTMVCYRDGQCDVMVYTYNRAEKAGIPIINLCDRLSGYLANKCEAKKMLQSYSRIESFNYCKEGIIFSEIEDEPLIIAFEEITKVENREEMLYLTLRNQIQLRTSLFMDECEICFPEMKGSPVWQKLSDGFDKLKMAGTTGTGTANRLY